MPGHGAMGGLILRGAVRRHQHGGHHGQAPEGGGHHVAHDVAVVVLAGPNKPALGADDPSYGVVNEGIEIGDAQLLKVGLVALELLLKHLLELAVIDLGDGVLGGEPQVLLGVNGVLEAGPGKGADAAFLVVLALPHGGPVHLLHGNGLLRAALALKGHGTHAGLGGVQVHALIHVAVGMPGDGNGLFPVLHHGMDSVHEDG